MVPQGLLMEHSLEEVLVMEKGLGKGLPQRRAPLRKEASRRTHAIVSSLKRAHGEVV